LPQISEDIQYILDKELREIVSNAAISTVSYYMTEFHDDMTQKWMVEFQDYKNVGFIDGDWNTYISNMIALDKLEINVYMNPPKKLSKVNSKPDANIRLMYNHDIQPRKVAHQIVTVREDVCSEIIQDLGSIILENKEAVKCAQLRQLHGIEYANKHRHPTRNSDMGGSTPLRNRNFNTIAVLITNVALDLIRQELVEGGDAQSSARLDQLIAQMVAETEAMQPAERVVRGTMYGTGPKWLVEELYFIAITEEAVASKYLKMAQRVLSLRHALALVACKLLGEQNLQARKYFKMIKDMGGFSKLDLGKSKVKLVDMADVWAAEAAAADAQATQQQQQDSKPTQSGDEAEEPAGANSVTRNPNPALPSPDPVEEVAGDVWDNNFFGPIAM